MLKNVLPTFLIDFKNINNKLYFPLIIIKYVYNILFKIFFYNQQIFKKCSQMIIFRIFNVNHHKVFTQYFSKLYSFNRIFIQCFF